MLDVHECPIVLHFSVLEKRWSVRLIRLLYRKPRKFNELKRALKGITQSMLTSRLREFQKKGLVFRSVTSRHPLSVSYSLASSARTLFACWLD